MSLCATCDPLALVNLNCPRDNDERLYLGILLNAEAPLMWLLREAKSRQTQRDDMEARLALRAFRQERRDLPCLDEATRPCG